MHYHACHMFLGTNIANTGGRVLLGGAAWVSVYLKEPEENGREMGVAKPRATKPRTQSEQVQGVRP